MDKGHKARCPVLLSAFNTTLNTNGPSRQFDFAIINLFDEFRQPSVPHFSKALDYDKIEEMLREFDRDIDSVSADRLRCLGRLIWNHVIPSQICEYLRLLEQDYSLQLLLVTNDIRIPWEITHDDKGFWALTYSMGRIYGRSHQGLFRLPVKGRPMRQESPPMLLIADPEGNLPHARQEADELSRSLRRTFAMKMLSGRTSAYEMAIAIGSDEYDIIHFAGHADMGKRSALRGYRSQLHSDTIADYSLPRRPVVFANACATGGKAYYGANTKNLAEAFIEAGAAAFVGTLWRTSDETSAAFAAEFYRHLRCGRTIGDSLRQAKTSLSRKTGSTDIDWAAFTLFGDPDSRLFTRTLDRDSIVRHVMLTMSNRRGTLGRILVAMSELGINIVRGRSITFEDESAAGYAAEIEAPRTMTETELETSLKKRVKGSLLTRVTFS